MVINQQKQHVSIQPTLNKQTLEQVTNYKYLGAIINEELDSDEQRNSTSKKTNCHIYLIHSNRWDLKRKYLLISTKASR
jgi:hypothetical protein